MKRMKLRLAIMTPLAVVIVLIVLAGCGPAEYGDGPEFDGGIGWDAGYYGYGYGGDRHNGAFHHDGGDRAGTRGHSSLGGRGGGGGGHSGGGGHGGGGGGGHGGGHR